MCIQLNSLYRLTTCLETGRTLDVRKFNRCQGNVVEKSCYLGNLFMSNFTCRGYTKMFYGQLVTPVLGIIMNSL